jgi:hypothetical protein
MAAELPVIATKWGDPADYLDETTGILIDPISLSREQVIIDAASAIKCLALDQTLALALRQSIDNVDLNLLVDLV